MRRNSKIDINAAGDMLVVHLNVRRINQSWRRCLLAVGCFLALKPGGA